MTAAKKPKYRDRQGGNILLGATIGQGGEAIVYEVNGRPDLLAKVYRSTPASYKMKLAWMIGHPPALSGSHVVMAWPTDLVLDRSGALKGYLMPRIHEAVPLLNVFNPRKREQLLPNFNRRYRYRAARNLAAAVQSAHDAGYVIGDLNESNALVTSTALVSLLDTDSFQVRVHSGNTTRLFRSPVGKPEYTPPELQGLNFHDVDRSVDHDRFALGVLIFQLLMEGNHPFRLLWSGSGEPPALEASISHGWFPYSAAPSIIAPPPGVPGLHSLDPPLAALVTKCFVKGKSHPSCRPSGAEWQRGLALAEANLRTCPHGHIYAGHLGTCSNCVDSKQPIVAKPSSAGRKSREAQDRHGKPNPSPPVIPPASASPVHVPPAPPAPQQPGTKKWPTWLKWVMLFAAILVVRNMLASDATPSPASRVERVRATSTARAINTVAPPTSTVAPQAFAGSLGGWGLADDFSSSSDFPAIHEEGAQAAIMANALMISVSDPDLFYWIDYPTLNTGSRDIEIEAIVRSTLGTGEVFIRIHSVLSEDDWFFAVDPQKEQWMLYLDSPESEGPFVWITQRSYAVSGKFTELAVRIVEGKPSLLVNGTDVTSLSGVKIPEMAGSLVVGFGAHAAPLSQAGFSASFDRFQISEI